MGYCVELMESTVSFTKEKSLELMEFLLKYIRNENPDWRWVSNLFLIENCREKDFSSLMEELGYTLEEYPDRYKIEYRNGEKLGDEHEIFQVIAPYVEDGYMEMTGEDGSRWRYVFNSGTFNEVYPEVKWN